MQENTSHISRKVVTRSMHHLYTRAFALCALANFAQAVSFSLFLHFPGFLKELGAGESEIGVLVALTALSTVVLGPFCGRLMDRHGRRPIIIGGNLLNVGAIGFYMTLHGLSPAMYVVRLFHGVAGMMLYSGLFTYAADIVPPARTAQGLALFGVSAMLSITVGGVIGDAALAWGGYQALFLTSLGCAIAGFALALPLRESGGLLAREAEPPRAFRTTLCQPNLVPLWLVTWMFFFAQAGVFTFLKTYVMATGFGTLGAFFTVYTLTAIVQRLALGWVPDRLGLTRVLAPALLAFVVGLLLLSMAGSAWQVWTAALFCGVGHGYAFPILLGLVSRRARVTERGTAMAIYTTIDDGAVLVAGPLLGFLIETMGYAPMFWSVAGLLAGTTVLFLLWDRKRQEGSAC
jgi:MFS family permease